ncbi:hypothetical protein CR513_03614, partial [Mucuna pruriens]
MVVDEHLTIVIREPKVDMDCGLDLGALIDYDMEAWLVESILKEQPTFVQRRLRSGVQNYIKELEKIFCAMKYTNALKIKWPRKAGRAFEPCLDALSPMDALLKANMHLDARKLPLSKCLWTQTLPVTLDPGPSQRAFGHDHSSHSIFERNCCSHSAFEHDHSSHSIFELKGQLKAQGIHFGYGIPSCVQSVEMPSTQSKRPSSKRLSQAPKNAKALVKKRKLVLHILDDEEEMATEARPSYVVEEDDDDDAPLVTSIKRKTHIKEQHGTKPYNLMVLTTFPKDYGALVGGIFGLLILLSKLIFLDTFEYVIIRMRIPLQKQDTLDTLTPSFYANLKAHLMSKLIATSSKLKVQHFTHPSLVTKPSTRVLIQPNRTYLRPPMLTIGQHHTSPPTKVGGIYASVEHPIDACSTLQETKSNSAKVAAMMGVQDLQTQIGQLATTMNQLQSKGFRQIPSQTIINPQTNPLQPLVITTNKLQAEQKERLLQDLKKLGDFYEHLFKHSTLRFLLKKPPEDYFDNIIKHPKDLKCPKKINGKKESLEGKEIMMTSRRVVRKGFKMMIVEAKKLHATIGRKKEIACTYIWVNLGRISR